MWRDLRVMHYDSHATPVKSRATPAENPSENPDQWFIPFYINKTTQIASPEMFMDFTTGLV